jgi:hypothetical protein
MSDIFWSTFYTKPARVDPQEGLSYEDETELLKQMCKDLLSMPMQETEPIVRKIQHISDEYALESPLTPSSSMFQAVEAGCVGETFTHDLYQICVCKKCQRPDDSDWLRGKCGERVLGREPYSFVHVNLSRRVGSIDAFKKLVEPAFVRKREKFLMIPGDSNLTLVMVARDREHEKEIRRILREKQYRIDRGIRIFDVTRDLMGRDRRKLPPPSD